MMCCVLVAACAAAVAQPELVSEDEAKAWVRYTVPLPKSIEIPSKAVVRKSELIIVPPLGPDSLITQACKDLRETMGIPEQPMASDATFRITLELGGPAADKLKSLRNADQAYRIAPEADRNGLMLVALKPVGLYYAAKTLQQLIKPRVTDTTVEIPMLRVTDWPDMEERGLWGAETFGPLTWLGDRKLNHLEQTGVRSVDSDGCGHAGIVPAWQPVVDQGPLYGIESVPISSHLEQSGYTGIFKAYPNLRGQGGHPGSICYSQPQIADVLADWIAGFASLPNVAGVDVWMSENLDGKGGCQCAKCRKTNRSVLEIRVILSAWRKSEERLGRRISLYVLSSEETYPDNKLVLAELPGEVRFWYYHWLTYNTGRWQMIPRCVSEAAKLGKWVGVVPSLDSMTTFMEPFTGADFIYYRMNEFVGKRLQGLLGFVTPRAHFFSFNVEAAAEWSWNAKGRTPEEFTLSYAIRHGINNPERWAEWAGLVGPVEWHVYGSEWPSGAQRATPDPVAQMLLEGRLPRLGKILWDAFRIPFGDIKTVKQLDLDVASAARALERARGMGVPEYWYESLVADGYIKSLKALYELGRIVKHGKVALTDRDAAESYFRMYLDGLKQASDALPKWEEIRDLRHEHAHYTGTPVKVIAQLRREMAEAATKLGFEIGP